MSSSMIRPDTFNAKFSPNIVVTQPSFSSPDTPKNSPLETKSNVVRNNKTTRVSNGEGADNSTGKSNNRSSVILLVEGERVSFDNEEKRFTVSQNKTYLFKVK